MAVYLLAAATATGLQAQTDAPATTSSTESSTESSSAEGASSRPEVAVVEVDLAAFLTAREIVTEQTEGAVWIVRPKQIKRRQSTRQRPSRRNEARDPRRRTPPARFEQSDLRGRGGQGERGPRLVLVPLRIVAPAQPTKLQPATLKLKGGRFVAWKLNDDSSADSAQRAPVDEEMVESSPQPPPGVPTFARKVDVDAGGALRWRVERTIPGGELKATESGYDLKIDSKRILTMKFEAGQPPEKPTGDVTRESRKQWRDSVAAYKRDAARIRKENAPQIRELKEQTSALPDEFFMARPQRIWAVFDIGTRRGELVVDGPGLPRCRISYDHLTAMRQLTTGGRQFDDSAQSPARAMSSMSGRADPVSQRLVAHVLAESSLMDQLEVGDAMFKIVKKMVDSPDPTARQMVIGRLLRTAPTQATNQLVAFAVPKMNATSKLDWLRLTLGAPANSIDESRPGLRPGLLPGSRGLGRRFALRGAASSLAPRRRFTNASSNDNDSASLAAAAANQLLQDPRGPSPAAILELLMRYGHSTQGNPESQDPTGPIAEAIRFDRIAGQRRDDAIAAVVRHAGTSGLAAYWLDHHLLGDGAGRQLQRRTVRTLAHAYGWHNSFSVAYESMADTLFGRADSDADVEAVRLEAPIAINSTKHGLFSALLHGDPQIRELSWQALPQFILPSSGGAYGAEALGEQTNEVLATLLTVARSQQVPRRQVIEFLRRQPDQAESTWALVSLAADSGPQMSAMAAHALTGSGRPVGEVLSSRPISPIQLHRFARSVYGGDEKAPLVTGLIRTDSPQRQIARWFADRVATGQVPQPEQWGSQYGQTEELIAAAVSSDTDLSSAAAAALAASAGAGDEQVPAIVKAIREAGVSEDARLEKWDQLRSEIFARRIKEAAGPYRLTLQIYEVDKEGGPRPVYGPNFRPGMRPGGYGMPTGPGSAIEPPAHSKPQVDRDLGIVQLTVEGERIFLGNQTIEASIPDDYLAIQIEDPNDLKNLVDDLGKLPLDELTTLELLSYQQSDWRGVFLLPDGRTAVLLMRRDGT